MKNARWLAAAAAVLLLGACASTGTAGSAAGPDFLSVSLLSTAQIRSQFGNSFAENPFFFPTAFLIRQNSDYLVLKLTVRTSAAAAVEVLQAEAVDSTGKVRATAFNRADFKKEAESLSAQVMNQNARNDKIDWYYLPSLTLNLPPGTHEYVLVLSGPHPFPDDLTVAARLTLNGAEQDFTLGVPGKSK